MHLEFFIVAGGVGGGADREDTYYLCLILKLCYKNYVLSITVT